MIVSVCDQNQARVFPAEGPSASHQTSDGSTSGLELVARFQMWQKQQHGTRQEGDGAPRQAAAALQHPEHRQPVAARPAAVAAAEAAHPDHTPPR